MIRAVHAAGVPVPEVFGEVTLDGRFGIVLQRLDGPTLWQLSRTGAVTFEQAGAIVAALAMSIHKTPPPPEVLSLRDYMEAELRHDDGKLPKHIATDILALIDRLPPGDGLCHCDLSPGNVIMTAEGPKLVDWTFAMRAPAALDLGFLHVILSELAPEIADNPERPRATNAAAQSEYARLAGMSLAELTAAMEPYLPIVRTFVVLGDVVPSLAGAADPAHRSGAALGRLNRLGRAREPKWPVEARRQCLLWVKTGNTLIEQKISALTPKADVCAFMSTRLSLGADSFARSQIRCRLRSASLS